MSGSGTEEAWRLRAGADELRALAARLEAAQAMTLHLDAGDATWRGPGPELCRRLLAGNQYQLRLAAEELRRRGGILDRRATEVEVEALLRSATG